MNIIIQDYYGKNYSVENIPNDVNWGEFKDEIDKLGLVMGFPPTILNDDDGDGAWRWEENNGD